MNLHLQLQIPKDTFFDIIKKCYLVAKESGAFRHRYDMLSNQVVIDYRSTDPINEIKLKYNDVSVELRRQHSESCLDFCRITYGIEFKKDHDCNYSAISINPN